MAQLTNIQKIKAAIERCNGNVETRTAEGKDKQGNPISEDYTLCEAEIFGGGTCGKDPEPKKNWRDQRFDGKPSFNELMASNGFMYFDPRRSPWLPIHSGIEDAKKAKSKIQVFGIQCQQAGALSPYEIARMIDPVLRGDKELLIVVLYGDQLEWENYAGKSYEGTLDTANELLKLVCDNDKAKELTNNLINDITAKMAAAVKQGGHGFKSYRSILQNIKHDVEVFITRNHFSDDDADAIRNRFILATSTEEVFSDEVAE